MYKDLAKEEMQSVINNFENTLSTIRTGRANPAMIGHVNVEYYGEKMPINQLGQISVVEGRQLVVKLYDPSQLKNVEKALNAANLGFPASNDGSVIRLNVPPLTTESRKQLTKEVSKYEEEAKVAIRNVRRHLNDEVKKDDSLSEDMEKRALEDVQKVTDDFIKKIEAIGKEKSAEILEI